MEHALEDLEVIIDIPNQPKDYIGNGYEIPENLQFLSLINNRLRKIENLEKCTCLQNLCLRQNTIKADSLPGLEPVSGTLKKLELYENQISGTGLSEWAISKENLIFPNLIYLDFSFNPIRQLNEVEKEGTKVPTTELKEGGPLSVFPNLEYLFFVDCKMMRVPPLSCLTHLRSLELGSNRIRTIEGLEALVNLEELWLGKNKITQIQNLRFPKLRILSLTSNRIVKIENLDNLPALEELYISENGIEIIENLDSLVHLTVLDLVKNRISVIGGLSALTKLEEFWLSYNQVQSFVEVEKLKTIPTLQTVYLEGNPFAADPQYRNKVLAELTQINQLDATMVVRGANPLLKFKQ